MSKNVKWPGLKIWDTVSLKLQALHREGKINDEQPLIKIDYRKEASEAPFRFDAANGKLHRAGCNAIPRDSRSAVYAVWKLEKGDIKYACDKCRPVFKKGAVMNKNIVSDIIFGFLSILDQFSSVLSERGKEYRNSEHGKAIVKTVETIFSELDHKQKETLNVMLSSLDGLLEIMQECNTSLQRQGNGKDRNGLRGNGNGRTIKRRQRKKNGREKI